MFIPRKIKVPVSKLISLPLIGKIVSGLRKELNYFGVKINSGNPFISDTNKAKIFWNIYESAEARLISKCMVDRYPVIELGSSLGIISTLIASKIHQKLICVEANPILIPSIEYNLKKIHFEKYIILNGAISYAEEAVRFKEDPDNNLNGRITVDEGVIIEKISLNDIVKKFNIDQFILVMDIEGSEIEILLNDRKILNKCHMIILEIHRVTYKHKTYTVEDIRNIIIISGFAMVERDGNCMVFLNKDIERCE